MTRTLRIVFLSRLARERVLIVALLLVMAVLWLYNFSSRVGQFFTEANHTGTELKLQARVLSNRVAIERYAKDEAAQLDPSKTLDGPRLVATLTGIAGEAGISAYTTSDPQDSEGGQFIIHSILFNMQGVPFAKLQDFYGKVQAHAPYISIESLSAGNNRANPNADALNVNLKVSSVEIKP